MKNNNLIVLFILFTWFVISFVTNILNPLMPGIIESFQISKGLAGFLPSSIFIAYFIFSIPAGALVKRYGPKITMLAAFFVNFLGAALFSVSPSYLGALSSLFLIGAGMAMLQVIINPLMRTAGGEQHFAFFSVLGQLVFGLASFVSPQVYKGLMAYLKSDPDSALTQLLLSVVPFELLWISLYWLSACIFVLMIALVAAIKLPKLEVSEGELTNSVDVYLSLLKQRHVVLFFLGIAAYVGTEQGIANWMSLFLKEYHLVSPEAGGADAVGWFWGLMSVGCVLGLVLLKLLDSRLVLKLFSGCAMICLMIAIFGSKSIALLAFPATGFFISVMFSIIFSLALNSVKEHHGAFSGILCAGIVGGAIVPPVVGFIADVAGLRIAYISLLVPLAYIMSIAYWAKPLINNETISFSKPMTQTEQ